MTRVRVKICGITTVEDARAAVEAGADALGLVFAPQSKRQITPATAKALCAAIPPYVSVVGLFVNPSAQDVHTILTHVPLDQLQFHGTESPDFCAQFGRRWYKAVPMQTLTSDEQLATYFQTYQSSSALLLDTFGGTEHGGSGKTFTWRALPPHSSALIIAGGLTIDNVGEAIAYFRPFAVDVSSGVESAPARKSFAKMKAFIDAVHQSL